MTKNTTVIFDSYVEPNLKIIRKEVEFAPVAEFRKSLIVIFNQLDRSDEHQSMISGKIWSVVSVLLTSVSDFHLILPDATEQIFTSQKTVKENWGYEIWANYNRAVSIAYSLISKPNPLLVETLNCIKSLKNDGRSFAIFYPKKWIPVLLESFKSAGIDPSSIKFISSVAEYRDSEFVDTIIKIGPMRTNGWSRTPDSLLTSPKCNTIIQIAWQKCPDESLHGNDPIVPVSRLQPGRIQSKIVDWVITNEPIYADWETPIQPPTIEASAIVLSDDLSTLSVASKDFRSAVLLSLDADYGLLNAPAGKIIIYNTNQIIDTCCGVRSAATVEPSSFIVIVGEYTTSDDSDKTTGLDNYSNIWKSTLQKENEAAPIAFIQKLEQNGLDLSELRSALRHWVRPTSTVIHAPQRREHFEIICRVLGLTELVNHRGKEMPLWRAAWSEITISRGEAIQAGMESSEKLESIVLDGLRKFNHTINQEIGDSSKFNLHIPYGEEGGYLPIILHKVLEVESGYRAPGSELRKILQLDYIQQWQ